MWPGYLGAVHEHEPGGQRRAFGPIFGLHPHRSGPVVVGYEARLGQEAQQLRVVVTGKHLDLVQAESCDGCESAFPHRAERNGRKPGDDDRVTLPRASPVCQQDARNRPFVVQPEELVDLVGATRRPSPPLHVGRLRDTRLGIGVTDAPEERGGERQILEVGGPNRTECHHELPGGTLAHP